MPIINPATVLENNKLTDTVFLLRMQAPDIAEKACAGQFVHIRCGEENLLRRPVSICDAGGGVVTVVVDVRGAGTRWLAERRAGDSVDMLGPLGHGFDVGGENILLIGGGIGVPPLLYTARQASGCVTAVLGFRTSSCVILQEEFKEACGAVHLTTDDGTAGEHGFVTDVLTRLLEKNNYDSVLACGPKQMLKAVADSSGSYGVRCQVSMEERMGCGVGACLVCACKTARDGKEHMSRVCKDGPVFEAGEVCWE